MAAPAPTIAPPQKPARRIPGEEGVWVFIFGDMCVFAVFFATYLYYRGKQPALFARSQRSLDLDLAALNTLLLLTSSLLVMLATRALRAPGSRATRPLLGGAFACGAGFVVVKVFEYHDLVTHHHVPGSNQFYTYYFVLTGLHLFHLSLGLCVLTALLVLARKPELSTRQMAFFEGGACFWHMVDLLWIVLFPLLYVVRS